MRPPGPALPRIRIGDHLAYDRAAGAWSLIRTGEPVDGMTVHRLRHADATTTLRPIGDQLPGFPIEDSQTWRCERRRRARLASGRAAPAAAPATASP